MIYSRASNTKSNMERYQQSERASKQIKINKYMKILLF